jgi:hypothetical protein
VLLFCYVVIILDRGGQNEVARYNNLFYRLLYLAASDLAATFFHSDGNELADFSALLLCRSCSDHPTTATHSSAVKRLSPTTTAPRTARLRVPQTTVLILGVRSTHYIAPTK